MSMPRRSVPPTAAGAGPGAATPGPAALATPGAAQAPPYRRGQPARDAPDEARSDEARSDGERSDGERPGTHGPGRRAGSVRPREQGSGHRLWERVVRRSCAAGEWTDPLNRRRGCRGRR